MCDNKGGCCGLSVATPAARQVAESHHQHTVICTHVMSHGMACCLLLRGLLCGWLYTRARTHPPMPGCFMHMMRSG